MPKIIPELRERILAAARRRLLEDESRDVSTRQLAADCGIAAGTVFNYFSTKEELLAAVMLTDWKTCLDRMEEAAVQAPGIGEGFLRMEALLRAFSEPFLPIWRRYDHRSPVPERHGLLIGQLRGPIGTLLGRFGKTCTETEIRVLAELLLAASQREAGTLDRLLPVMQKIIG